MSILIRFQGKFDRLRLIYTALIYWIGSLESLPFCTIMSSRKVCGTIQESLRNSIGSSDRFSALASLIINKRKLIKLLRL